MREERAGLIAPDEKTFSVYKGRPYAPKGKDWDMAVDSWKRLPSDKDAVYDKEVVIKANSIEPQHMGNKPSRRCTYKWQYSRSKKY